VFIIARLETTNPHEVSRFFVSRLHFRTWIAREVPVGDGG
jgi:hypothetical protein